MPAAPCLAACGRENGNNGTQRDEDSRKYALTKPLHVQGSYLVKSGREVTTLIRILVSGAENLPNHV